MSWLLAAVLAAAALSASADDGIAKIGFDCTSNKCTFKLTLPELYTAFVDVAGIKAEVDALGAGIANLNDLKTLVATEETIFQENIGDRIPDEQATADDLKTNATDFVDDVTDFSATLSGASVRAKLVADALTCILKNLEKPSDCWSVPTGPTTTGASTPSTTPGVTNTLETTASGSTATPNTATTESQPTPDPNATTTTGAPTTSGENVTSTSPSTNTSPSVQPVTIHDSSSTAEQSSTSPGESTTSSSTTSTAIVTSTEASTSVTSTENPAESTTSDGERVDFDFLGDKLPNWNF